MHTRREERTERPPWVPDSDEPYDQELQVLGYGRYALYAYAHYLLELQRFKTKHGRCWLLSDHEVEKQVADAAYRIGRHHPINEGDDSWLRRIQAGSRHQESEHRVVLASSTGQDVYKEWQKYVASCQCLLETRRRDSQTARFPAPSRRVRTTSG